MATIREQINSYITAANGITGKSDTTCKDAVQSLIDGYGGNTVYWNTYDGHQYTANVVIPNKTFTTNPVFRGATELKSVSSDKSFTVPSYFTYDTGVESVYLPNVTSVSNDRAFGVSDASLADKLQTIQIGSVGHGVSSLKSNTFYGRETCAFVGTFYCIGSYVSTLLSNIRTYAPLATINIYASATTTYNGTTYFVGEKILTSVGG